MNQDLEKSLKKLKNVVPTQEFRERALRNFVNNAGKKETEMFIFSKLITRILKVKKRVNPSKVMAARIREALHSLELNRRQFFTIKKFVASLVLATFSLVMVFSTVYEVTPTYAALDSYLEVEEGIVLIERGGELIEVAEKMLLKEGDMIISNDGTKAVVYYLDDSLTRLSERTKIKINEIREIDYKTTVDVQVLEGKVWTKVVNLTDQDNFKVRTLNLEVGVNKYATFSVDTNGGTTDLLVLDHKVNVGLIKQNKVVEEQVVTQGRAVSAQRSYDKLVPQKEDELRNDNSWIEENKEQDKKYLKDLVSRYHDLRLENAGILPGENLYSIKEFSHKAKMLLTFSEGEKAKLRLEIARVKLLEAAVLAEKGEEEASIESLQAYRDRLQEVLAVANALENGSGTELQAETQKALDITKKDLQGITRVESAYVAKEAVNETELMVAKGHNAVAEVKHDQAEDYMIEAKTLLEGGEVKLAENLLEKYGVAVEEVIEDAKQSPNPGGLQELGEAIEKDMEILEELKEDGVKVPVISLDPIIEEVEDRLLPPLLDLDADAK